MSFQPQMNRLSLDQAPPLSIPLSFFATAPVFMALAGLLLATRGLPLLASNWSPQTIGLTHLGTLGVLSMVMIGALYQMAPVVAAAPVPFIRIAHGVHFLLTLGVVMIAVGLLGVVSHCTYPGFLVVGLALLLFLATVGTALFRTQSKGETVWGMRVALVALTLVMLLGLCMGRGYWDGSFPEARQLWLQTHFLLAFLGWVGGLISAVSWQVVPMFYLSPPVASSSRKFVLAGVILGMLGLVGVFGAHLLGWIELSATGDPLWYSTATRSTWFVALASAPALAAVWGLHPHLIFHNLRKRRRKRIDGSLFFWQVGMCMAPLCGLLAVSMLFCNDARLPLELGWIVIWGWAGMIIHGMLTRIVPFLIWFHRYSPYVGKVKVASMRGLLPDTWTRVGFGLHLGTLVLGVLAIALQQDVLVRLTGVGLLATASSLGWTIFHLIRQFPDLSTLPTPSDEELAP
ncbi:MAG: hypothetical protein JRC77_07955 [Deltaproteobacteria bacterium]|nr:hypothetical protein [Deltaproteobacteria bacterium]